MSDRREIDDETVRAFVQQAVEQGFGETISDERGIAALARIVRPTPSEQAS